MEVASEPGTPVKSVSKTESRAPKEELQIKEVVYSLHN